MPAIGRFAVEAPGGVKPPPETPGPEWYAHTGNRALDPFPAGSPEEARLPAPAQAGLDLLDCGAFGAITRVRAQGARARGGRDADVKRGRRPPA
jgi:hypothetical protein